MSDLLRRALEEALAVLRRIEWSAQAGMKCPTCGRPKAYGSHVCSCPINLAFKTARKAGVEPASAAAPPVASGPFTLAEIPLVEWARWIWIDVSAGGDRARQFIRGKERTPDEVGEPIRNYAALKAEHKELFEQGVAKP